MRFVSLHHHTTFSYGDGFGPPAEHVEYVAGLGMTALACTEHGNTSSWVQLEKACEKFDIKPIYGCEIYIAADGEQRKCHQIVLAMNQIGLENLNRLVSQSWRDFYKWPTVYLKHLERFNEGLIILSGCADSQLSCTLLGGKYYGDKRLYYTREDYAAARRLALWYKAVFGDRYFLEVQCFPGLARTRILNTALERLSGDTGISLVATCDCHYLRPADSEIQKVLHASHRGSSVSQVEASWEYDVKLSIPTSDDEVWDRLLGTGLSEWGAVEAINSTTHIGEICNVELPKVEPLRYPISEADYEPWVK
jgi:DNA polymerase-3 subunit alpha